ncbi:hypothetical protein AB5I41_14595 [Sphingomonas sp. MMS24-JH45]
MGTADFTHPFVRDAGDGDLQDGGMAGQDLLDLRRVAVEASDDEDVLLSIGDTKVSGFIQHADIAGMQPSVRVDRLDGGRPIIKVAAHDVHAADDDLSDILARKHRPPTCRWPTSTPSIALPQEEVTISGGSSGLVIVHGVQVSVRP